MEMKKCPLCDAQATVRRSNFGEKINISCSVCGKYETTDEAINHIIDQNFGKDRRAKFQGTIQQLTKLEKKAQIIVAVDNDGKQMISCRQL